MSYNHTCSECCQSFASHDTDCGVEGCEGHFPPLCCPECPCGSYREAHPKVKLGPLRKTASGVWASRDGRVEFLRGGTESKRFWILCYLNENGSMVIREVHLSLREARREATDRLAREGHPT